MSWHIICGITPDAEPERHVFRTDVFAGRSALTTPFRWMLGAVGHRLVTWTRHPAKRRQDTRQPPFETT
jgi:hypothetical protein